MATVVRIALGRADEAVNRGRNEAAPPDATFVAAAAASESIPAHRPEFGRHQWDYLPFTTAIGSTFVGFV
jgi:hypothetical protein